MQRCPGRPWKGSSGAHVDPCGSAAPVRNSPATGSRLMDVIKMIQNMRGSNVQGGPPTSPNGEKSLCSTAPSTGNLEWERFSTFLILTKKLEPHVKPYIFPLALLVLLGVPAKEDGGLGRPRGSPKFWVRSQGRVLWEPSNPGRPWRVEPLLVAGSWVKHLWMSQS